MTQTRLFALLLAAPVWHGLLLGQQARDPATAAPRSPSPIAEAFGQLAALQRDDGRLVGAGADYRARFDRNGAQFTPALGELAPAWFAWLLHGREGQRRRGRRKGVHWR